MDPNTLDLGDETIRAKSIIIATGSKPHIPESWLPFKEFIIDTDQFFELETLPRTMAVFGLGVIGIELGQALHRIGVDVTAVTRRKTAGGLTDPKLEEYAFDHFSKEMKVALGTAEILGKTDTGLEVGAGSRRWTVDRVLIATGRRPVLHNLNLESLKIDVDDRGMPIFDRQTLQVGNLPVFLAGDVNGLKPILHEAADDGTIAGYNACAGTVARFKKRVPLQITFSSPDIAIAGLSHKALTEKGIDYVVGEASWEELGRARMMLGKAAGRARIYAEPQKGRLLGAEIMAPAGEHMAHLLAWAMGADLTLKEILGMPFYHPVPEEALLDAFFQIAEQISEPLPAPILEKAEGGAHGE
jgi:dihydrolipoamide dehydrogenase